MAGIGKTIANALGSVLSAVKVISNSFVGKCVRAVLAVPLYLPVAFTLSVFAVVLDWTNKCWSEFNKTVFKRNIVENPFF